MDPFVSLLPLNIMSMIPHAGNQGKEFVDCWWKPRVTVAKLGTSLSPGVLGLSCLLSGYSLEALLLFPCWSSPSTMLPLTLLL
jgi:hypothetical protein